MSRLRVDVVVGRDRQVAQLAADVWRGLLSSPKELPPRWFYDEAGAALSEEIACQPEYYLRRAEREILAARAGEIAALSGADGLVELGSGASAEVRLLLEAVAAGARLMRFAALDLSEAALRQAGAALSDAYPGVQLEMIVGDLERDLGRIPAEGRRLVACLGSTIGSLAPPGRARLFGQLAQLLRPGECVLLGADLVKEEARLVAAYDDAAGVTARLQKNLLLAIDRELGADLDPAAFDHQARWNREAEWIELHLVARAPHTVRVRAIGIQAQFAAGETLRTGIGAKFRRERLAAELQAARFGELGWWTDAAGDFSLSLWRRS